LIAAPSTTISGETMTRALRLLGLAAVLALVAALLGVGAASADETTPDPMVGAPAVGGCYDLTLKQAGTDSTGEATVDCGSRHTLLVGAVGELPESFDWDDSKSRYEYSHKICDPFWEKYYSISDPHSYLSLLYGVWFTPTKAQRDAGARWISCSIGVAVERSFLPLPKGGPAKMTKKPAASIARCADKRYRVTPCSKKHAWRATYAFGVNAKGSDKAVDAKVRRAARHTCPRKVSSEAWLLSYRAIGKNRYAAACYAQTKR
jgi:hypothetical protein